MGVARCDVAFSMGWFVYCGSFILLGARVG